MSDVVCPECGQVYTSIAQHWAKSSTCSYPNTPKPLIEIAYGILSVKGSVANRKDGKRNVIRLTSTDRSKVEKMSYVFGVYAGNISKSIRKKTSKYSGNDYNLETHRLSLKPMKEIQERPNFEDYTPGYLFLKSAIFWRGTVQNNQVRLRLPPNSEFIPHHIFESVFKNKHMDERKDGGKFIVYNSTPEFLEPVLETDWPTGWWNDQMRCDTAKKLRA